MNNDRFDDALRRKLEEVNPPFQEKNWTQLRRFMIARGFPPSIWHSPVQWLQPALTTAAAAGLLVVSVWQYRANQTLNDRIQTLTQTVTRLEQVQTDLQQTVKRIDETPRPPDTVYVVRRSPAPTALERTQPNRGSAAPDVAEAPRYVASDRAANRPETASDAYVNRPVGGAPNRAADAPVRSRPDRRTPVETNVPNALASETVRPNRQPNAGPTERVRRAEVDRSANEIRAREAISKADQVPRDRPADNESRIANKSTRTDRTDSPQPTSPTAPSNEANVYTTPDYSTSSNATNTARADRGQRRTDRIAAGPSRASAPTRSERPDTPTGSGRVEGQSVGERDRVAVNQLATEATAPDRVNPLTPVQALSQSDELTEQWQRRLRRVRYRSPYASALPQASSEAANPTVASTPKAAKAATKAATPEKQTHPISLRWRMGVGGDVSTESAGYGVYGEVIIHNRLAISAGVGPAAWRGDAYQSEVQFNERTKHDFRREYPGGNVPPLIGPGPIMRPREVLDISRSGRAVVVPIQVGYRLDVGRQWGVTPFLGANLSFSPAETVSFAYEKQVYRELERRNLTVDRPLIAYSSWTVGFGLERKFGPFVAQLSPVVSVPIVSKDSGLNTSSVGLRARLYYQF